MDSECSKSSRADRDETYLKKLEDEEDTHILACGGNTLNIHREIFKKNLHYLRPAIDVDIDDITEIQKRCLENIIEALVASSECKEMEDLLFGDIEDILGVDKGDIKPGTIGAYFFGCELAKKFSDSHSGAMSAKCNPLCVSSIGANLHGTCKDLVLIQTQDGLKAINQKISKHCYIYRADGNQGFVLDYQDYKSLRTLGVRYVTIVSSEYKTAHRVPLSSIRKRWVTPAMGSIIYFFSFNILALLAIFVILAILVFFVLR